MTILSKYIAKDFTKFFALLLTTFLSITLFSIFFGHLKETFSGGEELILFLKETALLIPFFLESVVPLTVLLSAIATFGSLSRFSEIVAMQSATMGIWRLCRPALLIGIGIALMMYFVQNYVQPVLDKHLGIVEEDTFEDSWQLGLNSVYYFGTRPSSLEFVESLQYFTWDPDSYAPLETISAQRGQRLDDQWFLQEVYRRQFFDKAIGYQYAKQEQNSMEQLDWIGKQINQQYHHVPFFELYQQLIERQNLGLTSTAMESELHYKLAYPVSVLMMIGIGTILGVSHHRQQKSGENIAISLVLGLLFWILNQTLFALGKSGDLSPFMGAWGANLLFSLILLKGLIWKPH